MRDQHKRLADLESELGRFQQYDRPAGLTDGEVEEWRQAVVTDAKAQGVTPVIVVREQKSADPGAFERLRARMQAASQASLASPSTHGEHQHEEKS